MMPPTQPSAGAGKKADAQSWHVCSAPVCTSCAVLCRSPRGSGVPQSMGAALCLRSGWSACNPLSCEQQILEAAGHPPHAPSPQLLPPKMELLSPENKAMWQCSQTLACNSSNLRAADCCSAINTTRAINKHYLSALVFLMPGHCALACGATQRLKAGFRDEPKLV